jgi:hypothetical protein
MGKILTAAQLEKRLEKRKAREAFKEAQAKSPTAVKAYTAEGASDIIHVSSIEDPSIIVKIPVLQTSIALVATFKDKLGWLTSTEAQGVAGAKIVEFGNGHHQVLRIRINQAKSTPEPKNTPWGTRVVDMIENSFQVPFSLGADQMPTLKEAKDAFSLLFGDTGLGKTLITKNGSSAELLWRGKVFCVMR